MSVANLSYAYIMVRRSEGVTRLAGFFATSLPTLLRFATMFGSMERDSIELSKEALTMAITKPRSKFIDTYWIIPRNSNKPSSKIVFTRNDRRIFNVLFKDDRLIWAGRKPVMEGIA